MWFLGEMDRLSAHWVGSMICLWFYIQETFLVVLGNHSFPVWKRVGSVQVKCLNSSTISLVLVNTFLLITLIKFPCHAKFEYFPRYLLLAIYINPLGELPNLMIQSCEGWPWLIPKYCIYKSTRSNSFLSTAWCDRPYPPRCYFLAFNCICFW